jgi:hypothetical protein
VTSGNPPPTLITEPPAPKQNSPSALSRLLTGFRRMFASPTATTRPKHRTPILRYTLTATLSLLTGCESTVFSLPGPPSDRAQYASIYPYYIETCALSALKKKPGFGFEYRGGSGGHAVIFLNGVCRDSKQSYPVVQICDDTAPSEESGVGLSSNGHFSNAAWVATPGRDFFFNGTLQPGEGVNTESYARTQTRAKQLGIYNGVRFHNEVFDDMPAGMTRAAFMYEASVATDYGISLGRGRFCARLPVSQAQMQRVVAYVNADNAQYRDGKKTFEMTVVGDNCSHFTHNVLAAAGLWDKWPTDRFVLVSALSFPVPKNEFVNQVRRSNDLPIDNPVTLFRDATTRQALLQDGWLPTGPGAISTATPIRPVNELYDTNVNLIFYDTPVIGPFQRNFDRITADRRYTDLTDNLQHFAALYAKISANRASPEWWENRAGLPRQDDASFKAFYKSYYNYIDHMDNRTNHALLTLHQATHPVTLAAQNPSIP